MATLAYLPNDLRAQMLAIKLTSTHVNSVHPTKSLKPKRSGSRKHSSSELRRCLPLPTVRGQCNVCLVDIFHDALFLHQELPYDCVSTDCGTRTLQRLVNLKADAGASTKDGTILPDGMKGILNQNF